MLTTWETQNFLLWLMGTFASVALSEQGLAQHRPMMVQLLLSIQRVMMGQTQTAAFVIASTRTVRRESYLSHLPPCFSSVSRSHLRQSDVDSDFLFDDILVDKTIEQAEKAALVFLMEATAKPVIKLQPWVSTPVAEEHSRRSPSSDSRSPAVSSHHCPFMKHTRS